MFNISLGRQTRHAVRSRAWWVWSPGCFRAQSLHLAWLGFQGTVRAHKKRERYNGVPVYDGWIFDSDTASRQTRKRHFPCEFLIRRSGVLRGPLLELRTVRQEARVRRQCMLGRTALSFLRPLPLAPTSQECMATRQAKDSGEERCTELWAMLTRAHNITLGSTGAPFVCGGVG